MGYNQLPNVAPQIPPLLPPLLPPHLPIQDSFTYIMGGHIISIIETIGPSGLLFGTIAILGFLLTKHLKDTAAQKMYQQDYQSFLSQNPKPTYNDYLTFYSNYQTENHKLQEFLQKQIHVTTKFIKIEQNGIKELTLQMYTESLNSPTTTPINSPIYTSIYEPTISYLSILHFVLIIGILVCLCKLIKHNKKPNRNHLITKTPKIISAAVLPLIAPIMNESSASIHSNFTTPLPTITNLHNFSFGEILAGALIGSLIGFGIFGGCLLVVHFRNQYIDNQFIIAKTKYQNDLQYFMDTQTNSTFQDLINFHTNYETNNPMVSEYVQKCLTFAKNVKILHEHGITNIPEETFFKIFSLQKIPPDLFNQICNKPSVSEIPSNSLASIYEPLINYQFIICFLSLILVISLYLFKITSRNKLPKINQVLNQKPKIIVGFLGFLPSISDPNSIIQSGLNFGAIVIIGGLIGAGIASFLMDQFKSRNIITNLIDLEGYSLRDTISKFIYQDPSQPKSVQETLDFIKTLKPQFYQNQYDLERFKEKLQTYVGDDNYFSFYEPIFFTHSLLLVVFISIFTLISLYLGYKFFRRSFYLKTFPNLCPPIEQNMTHIKSFENPQSPP